MSTFDWKRSVFWLIAAIVGTHLVIALAGVGFCMYYGQEIIEGKFKCDRDHRLSDILARPFSLISNVMKD